MPELRRGRSFPIVGQFEEALPQLRAMARARRGGLLPRRIYRGTDVYRDVVRGWIRGRGCQHLARRSVGVDSVGRRGGSYSRGDSRVSVLENDLAGDRFDFSSSDA